MRTKFCPPSAYLPVGDENKPGNTEKNSIMGTVYGLRRKPHLLVWQGQRPIQLLPPGLGSGQEHTQHHQDRKSKVRKRKPLGQGHGMLSLATTAIPQPRRPRFPLLTQAQVSLCSVPGNCPKLTGRRLDVQSFPLASLDFWHDFGSAKSTWECWDHLS